MKVQIKDFNKMVGEFGLDPDFEMKIIKVRHCFTIVMENYLPKDRIISVKDIADGTFEWCIDGETFLISEDMIEKKFLDDLPEELYISNEKQAESLDIFKEDIFAINLEVIDVMARKNGHCHYFKWKLTDNLSVRYFYNFEDRPIMNGKFAIKNHKQKELIEISKDTARELICSFCIQTFEEIIGYNVKKVGYRKYIKQFGGEFKEFVNV